eukprot:6697895-Karenia_brevis.AAC.1
MMFMMRLRMTLNLLKAMVKTSPIKPPTGAMSAIVTCSQNLPRSILKTGQIWQTWRSSKNC